MKLQEFKTQLGSRPDAQLIIALPDGKQIPRHFHVTEVGHISKRFVDCGGTFRSSETCVLQTWTGVEHDDGHRLTAGKLAHILGLAKSILATDELPVEVEYEDGVVSQFPIEEIALNDGTFVVRLGLKHTDCLAREKCGVPGEPGCAAGEADDTGCCGAEAGAGGRNCCG